ncbi:hypothetical protein, partial [Enterobacter kobei]|uniref:hypothetical protein n=1 Tax=Enterobacter kobei TaxID=208224 RepID=UPI0026F121E5
SLKTSIKTITNLSDTNCLEIHGASLALLGVALCGGFWFALNTALGTSPVLTETVLHVHKFLTVFIETYFWAHGAMGLLHIFLTVRSQRKNPVTE